MPLDAFLIRNRSIAILRIFVSFLLIVAWISAWTAASAQAFPTRDGVVADDTGLVDASQINDAAAGLEKLGITPLVVFSRTGLGQVGSEQLAYAAAENYGLAQQGRLLDPNLFAVVVMLDKRESTILYGDALKPYLGPAGGTPTLADRLREQYLNPGLAAGDYTAAFSNTLTQAAREIDLRINPPPTATPVPSTITNVDTSALGNSLLIGLGVLVALGLLAVIGPMLWRNWQRNKAAAARRQALQGQLLQARNVAADMITDLDYPSDPGEQIQYRFLALALGNERPKQLADITAQYEQIYDRLTEALATYNRLNQSTLSTEQELADGIAQYQKVQSEVRYANGFLEWLAEQSRIVEGQVAAAPTEVDAAKKALAAATEELAQVAAAAPDLELPSAETVLSNVSAGLSQADNALRLNPPRPLTAYDAVVQSRTRLEAAMAPWRRISSAYSQLEQQQAKVGGLRGKGFKLTEVRASFDAAVAELRRASEAAASGGAVEVMLTAASGHLAAAGESAERLVALQASNQVALDELQRRGDETRTLIEEGGRAFDVVDEYAEESWRDIRGNGTEAQRAADLAFTLWQQATEQNSVTPESPQDFDAARQLIDQANESLGRARELVGAIVSRLENIRESQRVAADEIAAAQRDITSGQKFVAQFDPDISPNPAELLAEAARLLEAARTEMSRPKPNWIEVVALARKANDTADRALANARSEQQAMEARRLKVKTASQQSDAALSRATNFATVHRADISSEVFTLLNRAQEASKQAAASLVAARSSGLEDLALGRALDQVAGLYDSARNQADVAFSQAETQFNTMEALRAQAYDALSRAESAIQSVDEFIAQNGNVVGRDAHEMLELAVSSMPQESVGNDTNSLSAAVSSAQQAQSYADQAYNLAAADVQAHNQAAQAQQLQDVLSTLAVLGAATAMSGGRRRRRGGGGWLGGGGISVGGGGGGWGGGGGSSSGGWGGGGSSSGGWGGGGSSGGSWGGGGSSSGGW